jgi:hypothetical protein
MRSRIAATTGPNCQFESGQKRAPDEPRHGSEIEPRKTGIRNRGSRMRWAALLKRIIEIDALRCPRWGSTMRPMAAIKDPDATRRILEFLKLPARAPPLAEVTCHPRESPGLEDSRFSISQLVPAGRSSRIGPQPRRLSCAHDPLGEGPSRPIERGASPVWRAQLEIFPSRGSQ